MSLLELSSVEVTYTRRGRSPVRAVAGASLELREGEIVGLVGESGCGKSTLARAAAGLVAPSAGQVLFEGEPLARLSRRARPRREVKLQMVFQDPYSSLNPRRRVGDQLADAIRINNLVPPQLREQRVIELLEQVGLPAAAVHSFPHQFSGGQRQRLAIARALAAEPTALVLDEPLSALDASAQAQVANLLVRLCRELKIAMLLISHDLAIVRQIADRISVMYLGLIVETGTTHEIWTDPQHPYTRALIGAIPHADGLGTKPETLPGEVPDPARPPAGCRFHPRCPHAFGRCAEESPPLIALGDGRAAACWLQTEDAGAQTTDEIEAAEQS
jgi:oligopeptide/dipeptide ABC transporter ATP-binding protein